MRCSRKQLNRKGSKHMNYQAYKLKFQGAVHLGKNRLENGEFVFCADTLFSALCHEALKRGQDVLSRFYQLAKNGEVLLSDAFPYMGDMYYLPKPMKRIQVEGDKGDSVLKKAYKKLRYIPAEQLGVYLREEYDVLSARSINELGHFEMKVSAAVRGEEETQPYRVGCYYYNEGNGLYIILGYSDTGAIRLVEELLESLAFSGIGGKRSSGLGRFGLHRGKLPSNVLTRLEGSGKRYMTLSVSLPTDNEMEDVLDNAEYLLCKRSGFVASEQYAMEQQRRRDLYVLQAGTCIGKRYNGDIYDVSDKGGNHPVYRYAKPMLMEVDV